jgi:hypothetical protein
VVADAGFSGVSLIAALRRHACLVTRLRIDASLFAPAPPRRPGQMGCPRLKGQRLPGFKAALADPDTVWSRVTVAEWYGGQSRELEVASDTAVWYHSGLPQAPIRWVLVGDPAGESEPQAFLSTDLAAEPGRILGWFVLRWQMETTFQGDPRPPWRGDAAAVVRPRHPAHDPRAARLVLLGHDMGRRTRPHPGQRRPPANRRLV